MFEKYAGRCLYFLALVLLGLACWLAVGGDVWSITAGALLTLMAVLYAALGLAFVNFNNQYFIKKYL